MSFKDWESFNDDRIKLPIKGNVYELPEISAKLGIELRLAQAGKPTRLQKLTPEEEAAEFLGTDLYRRMLDDGVSDKAIARAVVVVLTDWRLGRDAAKAVWEAGINPEALAAKLAAIVAAQETSTSTDAESTTPQPASTSGTSSPKTTPRANRSRKAPAKAAASPGSTSPSSGD